jgi:hypothetical protein
MALIPQMAQIGTSRADGTHLRHQRDLRDLRRPLEHAMMPETRRPDDSRFLDSPSARSE